MGSDRGHACPCCGYLTLPEPPPGTFEICPVCFWEDDDADGGANAVTLAEARESFGAHGVSELRFKRQVRPPRPKEQP